MDDNGFFGGLFDFDNNGKLDDFERAAEFAAFMNLVENGRDEDVGDDPGYFSGDSDEYDSEDGEDFDSDF